MKDYQQILIEERKDFVDKFIKLSSFLQTTNFDVLLDETKKRLERQEVIMIEYLNVLDEHIKEFEQYYPGEIVWIK